MGLCLVNRHPGWWEFSSSFHGGYMDRRLDRRWQLPAKSLPCDCEPNQWRSVLDSITFSRRCGTWRFRTSTTPTKRTWAARSGGFLQAWAPLRWSPSILRSLRPRAGPSRNWTRCLTRRCARGHSGHTSALCLDSCRSWGSEWLGTGIWIAVLKVLRLVPLCRYTSVTIWRIPHSDCWAW